MSTTEFITNPDRPDETVVVHTARFDGLLDENAALRAQGYAVDPEMQLRAQVPGIMIEQYCILKGVSWPDFFADKVHIKRLLDENPYFYTSDKRL